MNEVLLQYHGNRKRYIKKMYLIQFTNEYCYCLCYPRNGSITRECACFIHCEETRFLGYFSSNLDIIIFEYILCI